MKKKINYAKKDVLSGKDFEREKEEGSKYHTLINQALQEAIKKPSLVQRIERLEQKIG